MLLSLFLECQVMSTVPLGAACFTENKHPAKDRIRFLNLTEMYKEAE